LKKPASWLFGAVLLGLAVRLLAKNPEPLRQLVELPAWMVAALLPLALLNSVFQAFRMALAVGLSTPVEVPARTWLRVVMLGQFLNLMVPQLGNLYRGVTLKREYGVTYTAYATGLFTFVWLDTTFGFGLCILVLAVLQPGLQLGSVPVLPVLGIVLTMLLSAPIAAAKLLGAMPLGSGRLARAQARANGLLTTAGNCLQKPRFLLKFMAVCALVMAEQALILWLCFRVVGLAIDAETAVLFQTLIKLSNQVVITPGNLGLTELAFGVLGSAARGGSMEYGIAAALVFRTLFTSIVVVVGVLLGGIGLLRSRQATQEAADLDARDR
jgi:hypothetical protein